MILEYGGVRDATSNRDGNGVATSVAKYRR